MRKSLLIVYHSQSGASAKLASAALRGAREEPQVDTCLQRAVDAGIADVAAASGLLLIAAENAGFLSGGSKDFLDRVFYPAIERQLVLPYALLVSAGNDGRGAVRQAQRILSGIPFTAAAEPLILRGEPDSASLAQAAELGQAFATGMEMGIY
jgi:multimeric flavodoxin WrbA